MYSPRIPWGLGSYALSMPSTYTQHIYKSGYLKEVLHFKMSLPIFITTHLVQSVTFKIQNKSKAKLPYVLSNIPDQALCIQLKGITKN